MSPTLLFLVIVYAVTWVLCLILRPFAGESLSVMLVWLLPTVWSPTVAAIALSVSRDRVTGVRRALAPLRYTRGTLRWMGVALLFPAFAVAASVAVARSAGQGAPMTPAIAIPMMIALQIATGATGEELGWRGFLLTRWNSRMGVVRAAWTMGVLWALWHVAGAFFPGTPLQIAPPALFLLVIATFGVFLAFLFDRTRSVLPTMAAHLSLNVTLGLGGAQITSPTFWRTLASIMVASAIIITVAWNRRHGELPQRATAPAV
jgi:membrane protease YdiL (CAAX protease family)